MRRSWNAGLPKSVEHRHTTAHADEYIFGELACKDIIVWDEEAAPFAR